MDLTKYKSGKPRCKSGVGYVPTLRIYYYIVCSSRDVDFFNGLLSDYAETPQDLCITALVNGWKFLDKVTYCPGCASSFRRRLKYKIVNFDANVLLSVILGISLVLLGYGLVRWWTK